MFRYFSRCQTEVSVPYTGEDEKGYSDRTNSQVGIAIAISAAQATSRFGG
jgi:hypothetical protein